MAHSQHSQPKPETLSSLENNESLIDNLLAETHAVAGDDAYNVTKSGLEALIRQLAEQNVSAERIDKMLVDRLIASIDQVVSVQVVSGGAKARKDGEVIWG